MKNYKITIKEAAGTRNISVIAKCWHSALLIVRPQLNENASARVTVRLA